MRSESASYKAAGVDITAGYRAVELMKKHVQRTERPGVLGGLGGFGGLFLPDLAGMKEPVLVSGTDGVGTKLKIAFLLGKHDTVGIDCVAMCVNDIVCSGAEPLFFLDYIACGRNVPERIAEIVAGVAEAASRPARRSSAARPPRCRAFTPRTSTTWRLRRRDRGQGAHPRQLRHAGGRRAHSPALLGRTLERFSLVRRVSRSK